MKRVATIVAAALLTGSLAGVALAQQGPPAGAGRHDGPHGRMMMHMCADRDARAAGILAFAKARLGITADEEPAWATFTKAVSDAEAPVKAACAANAKAPQGDTLPTAPERFRQMTAMAQARAESLAKIAPALDTLYSSLTPAQQKIADEMANHRHH